MAAESPRGSGVVIHNALTFASLSDQAEAYLHGVVLQSWHDNRELLKEFLVSFQVLESVLESATIKLEITNEDIVKGFQS